MNMYNISFYSVHGRKESLGIIKCSTERKALERVCDLPLKRVRMVDTLGRSHFSVRDKHAIVSYYVTKGKKND